MRPLITFRNATRALRIAAALAMPATAGCSALTTMAAAPTYDPSMIYLTTPHLVVLKREYIDRYTCAADRPMVCQCFSRLSESCDCQC